MVEKERFVVALDDVPKVFDNVVPKDVMEDHRRYIKNRSLLALIEQVLRGGDDENRSLGIHQGDPYSPIALNVRLHHAYDVPFSRKRRYPPAFRYADNLCYLCASVSEGTQVLDSARLLLAKAGLTLKGEDGPPTDLLQGGTVQLLSFSLSVENGRPYLGLGKAVWTSLEQDLNYAHDDPHPPDAAQRVVTGWIESHGPAFEGDVTTIVPRILETAALQGFRELDSPDALQGRMVKAHRRWNTYRKLAFTRRRVRDVARLHVGAPPPTVDPVA